MAKIIQSFLTPSKLARPKKPLNQIKALVIHWVANPNSTAKANRDFFENKKYKPDSDEYGSAHEVIDLNGDIVLCIPDNEVAYHTGSSTYTQQCLNQLGMLPNLCTYGIECTHVDVNGRMTDETYNSLVERCVVLCEKYKLNPLTDIWLHKEVVGWKDCHRWFVLNPKKWIEFKRLVADKLFYSKVINNPYLVNSPAYWKLRNSEVKFVKGEYTRELILKFVAMFKTLNTFEEVVSELVNMGVISSPEYWLQNAVENKKIRGDYAKRLMINMGSKL
jgi:N-acetylmuramoyl-L-alanine amidase